MQRPSSSCPDVAAPGSIWVREGEDWGSSTGSRFDEPFCIGRDPECALRLHSSRVSRRHAEIVIEEGQWWIVDLGSTNGTFVDGVRITRALLQGEATLTIGDAGPVLQVRVDAPPEHTGAFDAVDSITTRGQPPQSAPGDAPPKEAEAEEPFEPLFPLRKAPVASRAAAAPPQTASGPPPRSVDTAIRHYFGDENAPAGERTILIRQAFRQVHKKQQRTYGTAIGIAVAIALLIGAYAVFQHFQMQRMEARAGALFTEMREDDLELTRLRMLIEEQGGASVEEQLNLLEERRERKRRSYDGFIEEMGIRRGLTEEEKVIYKVARIFNESELQMPAGFVRATKDVIHNHWQTRGRQTFVLGIQRAQENGYTPLIVEAFRKQGLPPEFFYLALQESVFEPTVSGPATRWGIAKGMWQFIPDTGASYGLRIGPRKDERVFDPLDERYDAALASDAAARYLRDIYAKLARASGLLAMASYNWGERRVVSKLDRLLEDIPDTPEARSYWRFYSEYDERMPEETKDYVLKIFAAAVIGEDPRLFGFDFDNPLAPYLSEDGDPDQFATTVAADRAY